MKTFKKSLALVMSLVLLLSAIPMIYANAATRTVVDSGFCGSEWLNLNWTLYSDGELVIDGTGAMSRFPWGAVETPWHKYSTSDAKTPIKVITLEEGVTSIGYDAFDAANRTYTRINLPESLEFIEGYPFDWHDAHKAGAMVAVCYAGSESDWNTVEHRNYKYELKEDKTFTLTSTGSEYGKNYSTQDGTNYIKMFFNGNEPMSTCEFATDQATVAKYGEQLSVCAYYYAEKGESVEWRVKGDSATIKIEDNIAYVNTTEQGEIELTAVLVDKDGDIVDYDTLTVTCEYNTLLVLKVFFTEVFNLLVEFIGGLFG